jgi:vacuolar protein sorting-associated protein 54
MTKIKAVLDQETWVEIDVPDEFQSIINMLFSSDALSSGNLNGVEEDNSISYHDMATTNDARPMADTGQSNAEQNVEQTDSTEESKKPNRGHSKSVESISTEKDHKKSASQALVYKGVGYHMVNWLVIWTELCSFFLPTIACSFYSVFYSLFSLSLSL